MPTIKYKTTLEFGWLIFEVDVEVQYYLEKAEPRTFSYPGYSGQIVIDEITLLNVIISDDVGNDYSKLQISDDVHKLILCALDYDYIKDHIKDRLAN